MNSHISSSETPLAHLRRLIAEWQYDAAISLSYAVMHEQGSPAHQSFTAECRMAKKHADQLSILLADLDAVITADATAAPAVEGARPQEEKDRNDHARVDTPGTPVDSLTAPTDEPVRHFRSCCCPAAHGENCPLTPDECDARTADYIGIPWFGARLRKVWDGFVHESLNGVVCSIPDTGLETAPHRTWCVRCQRRYRELKTLVEMLESHVIQVATTACVETIERLARTYANPPMPLTDDERADLRSAASLLRIPAVSKALDAAAALPPEELDAACSCAQWEHNSTGVAGEDIAAIKAAWQLAMDRNLAQQQQIEGLQREIARLQGLLADTSEANT